MGTTSTQLVAAASVPVALVVHQVFRKHETYAVHIHAGLLLIPPVLVAAVVASFSPRSPSILLPSLRDVFVALGVHLLTVVLSVILYRLSPFHPLAHVPGPAALKTSMLVAACDSVTGYRAKHRQELHKRFGDIVRVGPNEVSIIDPNLINAIMGSSGLPKGPYFVGGSMSDKNTNIQMVGIQDTDVHLRRRRPWNRALGPGAVKEYEVMIALQAGKLVQRLEQQKGRVLLGQWFSYFAYDFMSDMAFGGGSELLRYGDRGNVWSILEKGMIVGSALAHLPWLGIYLGYIPGAAGPLNTLCEGARQLAGLRLARGSNRPDLFRYLNHEDLPSKDPPPMQQVVNDGILAVVAGSDTTSVALTCTVFCILTNPDCYAILQAEIDKFYPRGEDPFITGHHHHMPYLHAVINEALRLYPPVPVGTQRWVPRDSEALVLGSFYLPPGTTIVMPPWTMHRNARNFTHPDTFWPERWLIASGKLHPKAARLPTALSGKDASPAHEFVHNEIAFMPFSYGPMNCPGKGLALLEMRMVICALMQRFRIRKCDGWDPREFERGIKEHYTAVCPPLPVTLEPRW